MLLMIHFVFDITSLTVLLWSVFIATIVLHCEFVHHTAYVVFHMSTCLGCGSLQLHLGQQAEFIIGGSLVLLNYVLCCAALRCVVRCCVLC